MSAYIEEAWVGGYISHLSASSLRLLRVCPEAWRRRYILGERERPGEALVLGKAVHSALEHTHRQKVPASCTPTTLLSHHASSR